MRVSVVINAASDNKIRQQLHEHFISLHSQGPIRRNKAASLILKP